MSSFRLTVLPLFLILAGCVVASREEQAAVARVRETGAVLRPAGRKPDLPALTADSSLADYLRFALLNHPQVEAAYDEWRGAVLDVAPARALPDPQFTFEADIADTLMTFMPGLMFDFMSRGKRVAMGREAVAASEVAYRNYATTVLRTAADVHKAWIELAYVEEVSRLYTSTISAAEEAIALANADYVTGRGMANFEPQVRFQNVAAQHHAHHAALADRKIAARARFKSALGLAPTDSDPPWPQPVLTVTAIPPGEELWQRAQAGNAGLAKMRTMVEMAVAGVEVARKAGTPDFALGAMIDLKADPLMVRPTASVTLPIWREKISATIAAAEARRDASVARLNAEQLNLAAELAQTLYLVRESDRMLAYIDQTALPNLDRSTASVEAAAQSGMTSATMIAEIRMMAIDLRHEHLDALRDRENAAVDLALLLADVVPAGVALPADVPASR